jgi:hypothetical protein
MVTAVHLACLDSLLCLILPMNADAMEWHVWIWVQQFPSGASITPRVHLAVAGGFLFLIRIEYIRFHSYTRLYPVEKTFVCIQFATRNSEKIGPIISSGGDSGCWYVAISIKLIAHISFVIYLLCVFILYECSINWIDEVAPLASLLCAARDISELKL